MWVWEGDNLQMMKMMTVKEVQVEMEGVVETGEMLVIGNVGEIGNDQVFEEEIEKGDGVIVEANICALDWSGFVLVTGRCSKFSLNVEMPV